ncbi:hypothetical protein CRG98_027666 [Punica granatum]|nr:hypothetical protein CRG98_027666 [Punica granatum]
MELPVSRHHDILMASSHNSPLQDMLACGQKVTPQQEQRDNSGGNNSKAAGNKPQPEQALKCPRCDSTNTKFCYYNNYSLSQPRYFCKSCRRYWTKGGTLRNVPVGGGCRKNKRPSSSSSSTSKRPNSHLDPQFSAVATEATSIPLVNRFPMDLGLGQFGGEPQKRFEPNCDLSFLGSLGLHGMISSTPNVGSSSVDIPGFFDSVRNGLFHETQHHQSSFHNFYHGAGEIPGPCEELSCSVMKREMMSDFGNDNRVLWGFPWSGNSEEVDSAR